jgi:hypothetical protein
VESIVTSISTETSIIEDYLIPPAYAGYFRQLLSGVRTEDFPVKGDELWESVAYAMGVTLDLKKRRKIFIKHLKANGLPEGKILEEIFKHTGTEEHPVTWEGMQGVIGPVTWSWEGWLPDGFVTILAGVSGEGKSQVALHIVRCFTTGSPWPDGKLFAGEVGAALWCEAESAQALNLDRGIRWKLPMDKIYAPLEDPLMDIKIDSPEHQEKIERCASRPEVKIIVVDSLRGAHRRDENSSESVGVVLWLAELAKRTGKPILVLHHLRKKSKDEHGEITLDRLRGSSALVQPAREIGRASCRERV